MMLHMLFGQGAWFARRSSGSGTGLPIAWQGWALLVSYLLLMIGLILTMGAENGSNPALGIVGMALATSVLVLVARARTQACQ